MNAPSIKLSALPTIRLAPGPVLVGLLIAGSPALAADSYESMIYPADGVRAIAVETDGGAITLTVTETGTVTVDASPAALPGDDCRVVQQQRGGTLTLSAHAPKSGGFFGGGKSCHAGFTVGAPARVAIKAASGSGAVSVGAFSGKTEVKTGSGDIELNGFAGSLTARSGSGKIRGDASGPKVDVGTGSGDVTLSSLTAPVVVKTGSGSTFLSWISVPRGSVDVRSGSGDLTAVLPAATKLRTSFRSGSGSLRSNFSDDSNAPLELTFRSGSGGATIKKAK